MWSVVAIAVLIFISTTNACSDVCNCKSELEDLKNTLLQAINKLGPPPVPSKSCAEILEGDPSAMSGEYTIETEDGELKQVYCEMDKLPACGDTGGWQRIGTFKKTPITDCPPEYTDENFSGHACGRTVDLSCSEGIKFNTAGQSYTEVCGKVLGYQVGSGDSFRRYSSAGDINNIDTPYLDGISITRGMSPRVHLWSYVASHTSQPHIICPCTGLADQPVPMPNFVGNNYYCEGAGPLTGLENVLWDGVDCSEAEENGCCKNDHPDMPWFHRGGLEPSSDDIELRVCSDEPVANEKFPFTEYEFYIR